MNKKYQQLVPLGLIAAVIIAIVIIVMVCTPKIEELSNLMKESKKNAAQKEQLENQVRQNETAQQAKDIKLRALKPIYEAKVSQSTQNLGIFGTMFDDVIRTAQVNGLLIRSIEYDMQPKDDPLYKAASKYYNVCELKFYFVATYTQMQSFLNDLNRSFPYLISLSSLTVTAFSENPNYLLIKAVVTLYSQKIQKDIK